MWVPIDLSAPGTRVDVVTEGGEKLTAVAAGLPFVDPEKRRRTGPQRLSSSRTCSITRSG